MKISWMLWWICSAFWFVLFIAGSIFVWMREIDGAGAVQTPEIKLVSFIVLMMVFIFPAIIQVIWFIINLLVRSNRKTNAQY